MTRRPELNIRSGVPRPVSNPPNPWHVAHIDWEGEPPPAELHVYTEQARSAVSENSSPDIPFRYSVNPYRGCYHGCAYCYARPTHQYWDLGAGTDFERRIIVKTNIVERLRETFARPSWQGDLIVFSGNTDCYQPLEAAYRLTRGCLDVCLEHQQPITIITKGSVIRRDIEVLAELGKRASVAVFLSIPFASDETSRALEPWASPTSRRFETMRQLSEAGIPTGISLAPVVPGLSESDIARQLRRAKDAGASFAALSLLRLAPEVQGFFEDRLRATLPLRADRVLRAVKEMREGHLTDKRFGHRMRGTGPRWNLLAELFTQECRRLGLEAGPPAPNRTFRRPSAQLELWSCGTNTH